VLVLTIAAAVLPVRESENIDKRCTQLYFIVNTTLCKREYIFFGPSVSTPTRVGKPQIRVDLRT
jgi:hypothetical protein